MNYIQKCAALKKIASLKKTAEAVLLVKLAVNEKMVDLVSNNSSAVSKKRKPLPQEALDLIRVAKENSLLSAAKHGLIWGGIGGLGTHAALAGMGAADQPSLTDAASGALLGLGAPYEEAYDDIVNHRQLPINTIGVLGGGIGIPAAVGALVGGLGSRSRKQKALSTLKSKYGIDENDIDNVI